MGYFNKQPGVKFLPDGREVELLETVIYYDNIGIPWIAPKGAVVNGASIPRWLWTFIGSPWVGKYRRASIIHDYYCTTKERSAKRTHKVWCEMIRSEGVSKWRSHLMCFAVRYFARRWK